MRIPPIYSISFLIISILMTIFFIKRSKNKGCLYVGYIGILIIIINMFTIASSYFFVGSVRDVYKVMVSGKSYSAKVISFIEKEEYDSDRGHYIMYQPTVSFVTEAGNSIEKQLNFSTSSMKIGDTYKINYDEKTGQIITLGFILVIKTVASFIFCFLFTFLSAGIINYCLGKDMEGYYALISKIGFKFFVPFLMIGFDALLIYGLFYGNKVPFWASALLVFFIVVLTLGIFAYLKLIISKGTPTMRRTGHNRWEGNWENK